MALLHQIQAINYTFLVIAAAQNYRHHLEAPTMRSFGYPRLHWTTNCQAEPQIGILTVAGEIIAQPRACMDALEA